MRATRTSQEALRAARRARLRGAILLLLAEAAPEPINAEVLRSVLERSRAAGGVTRRELARALDYLRGRGYVDYQVVEARDYPELPRLVGVRITAAGVDLVEATTDDPGVDLE